jgi:hypothetical protein
VEHNFHFKGKYMNQAMPATKGSIQCPQCRRQPPHLVTNGSTTELPVGHAKHRYPDPDANQRHEKMTLTIKTETT